MTTVKQQDALKVTNRVAMSYLELSLFAVDSEGELFGESEARFKSEF
jgi:muconolactone delta-isomerase